jgi:hypothetical protein
VFHVEQDGQRPTDDPAFTSSNRAQIERRWPGTIVILGK